MRLSTVIQHIKRVARYKAEILTSSRKLDDVVFTHFRNWSGLDHVNFELFKIITRELGGKPANIVETGTSAWGTDSTRYWNTYITLFGGHLTSVDIRPEAGILLKHQLSRNTDLVTSDSVDYLRKNKFNQVNVFYFDSADVDWSNPEFSIEHGLAELLAVIDDLEPNQIIIFDDTPKSHQYVEENLKPFVRRFEQEHGFTPGKGGKAIKLLMDNFEIKVLFHEYAFACRIISKK